MSKSLSDLLLQKRNPQLQFEWSSQELSKQHNSVLESSVHNIARQDPVVVQSSETPEDESELEMPCSSETVYVDDDELENGIVSSTINVAGNDDNRTPTSVSNNVHIKLHEKQFSDVLEPSSSAVIYGSQFIDAKEVSDLKSLVDELKQKNTEFRNDLNISSSEITRLRAEIRNLHSELEGSAQEKKDLQEELNRARREHEQALSLHEQRWNNCDYDRKRADEIITSLRAEVEEKLQSHAKLSNEMLSLERSLGLIQGDNAALRQRISHFELLDREIAQLRWRTSTLEAANADLIAQNSFLRSAISSSSSSASITQSSISIPAVPTFSHAPSTMPPTVSFSAIAHDPPPPAASAASTANQAATDVSRYAAAANLTHRRASTSAGQGQSAGGGRTESAGSLLSMEDFGPAAPPRPMSRGRRSVVEEGESGRELVTQQSQRRNAQHDSYPATNQNQNQNQNQGSTNGGFGPGSGSGSASGSARSLSSILQVESASSFEGRPRTGGGVKSLQQVVSSKGSAVSGFGLVSEHDDWERGGSGGGGSSAAASSSSNRRGNSNHSNSGVFPGAAGSGAGFQGPFATEKSSKEINQVFEVLDRQLTSCMTEKTSLQEENEKLLQRGLKTLKERTRQQQIEFRLEELGKDISALRKQLSLKPS